MGGGEVSGRENEGPSVAYQVLPLVEYCSRPNVTWLRSLSKEGGRTGVVGLCKIVIKAAGSRKIWQAAMSPGADGQMSTMTLTASITITTIILMMIVMMMMIGITFVMMMMMEVSVLRAEHCQFRDRGRNSVCGNLAGTRLELRRALYYPIRWTVTQVKTIMMMVMSVMMMIIMMTKERSGFIESIIIIVGYNRICK